MTSPGKSALLHSPHKLVSLLTIHIQKRSYPPIYPKKNINVYHFCCCCCCSSFRFTALCLTVWRVYRYYPLFRVMRVFRSFYFLLFFYYFHWTGRCERLFLKQNQERKILSDENINRTFYKASGTTTIIAQSLT